MLVRRSLLALAVVPAVVACHRDATPLEFSYRGDATEGRWVRLRNIEGNITVTAADGGQLEITGREVRGGSGLRFAYDTVGGDVTVCALYGSGGRCSATEYRSSAQRTGWWRIFGMRGRTHGSAATFTVALPAGMRVDASTVNGAVLVAAPAAAVVMKSVNGPVSAEGVSGPVDAETVNGNASAIVTGASGRVRLHSVNGRVTATLPADASGSVDLRTVNGSVSSDFVLPAGSSKHRLQGTIGAGGPTISLETVNGSVSLKRG